MFKKSSRQHFRHAGLEVYQGYERCSAKNVAAGPPTVTSEGLGVQGHDLDTDSK